MSGGKGESNVRVEYTWLEKGKIAELVYLLRTEAGGNPGVFLQCTSRVIIRGGVPLEVVHQLGDGLLHLQRHGCHNMLLYTNRFSGHRYSCRGNRQESEKEAERRIQMKKESRILSKEGKKMGVLVFFLLVFQTICGTCRHRFSSGKHQVHQGCRKKWMLWTILFCLALIHSQGKKKISGPDL